MIVKIQRPLASTQADPPALIYNEDRTVMLDMPMSPELKALFKHDELKVYHEATVEGGNLIVGRRVQNPGW